ncbi:MAG: DUF1501 domain-containing protein [Halioglobus sp.]
MYRRDFTQSVLLGAITASAQSLLLPLRAAAAQCSNYPSMDRTVVNVMLNGGADLRFLFMPAPNDGGLDPSHLDLIWRARKNLYTDFRDDPLVAYEEMFNALYNTVQATESHPAFGIHKRCGWLYDQFNSGNVAIVANAVCSSNRRHDQSILNANAGIPGLTSLEQDRDGWGGRLVEHIGGDSCAVELGNNISVFNIGSNDGNRLANVVHAADVRNISLPTPSANGTKDGDVVARAIKEYYAGRGPEVANQQPQEWLFHTFFNHNTAFRSLESQVVPQLDNCEPLFNAPEGLYSSSWGKQCRNLHDVCLTADILKARVISMSYGGWDSHGDEESSIGKKLEDMFGTGKGLDLTLAEIETFSSGARDKLVFYFASDFGRQLVSNGDYGTDHGSGSYGIVIGTDVAGGVYGNMFPVSEADPNTDSTGEIPLQRHGADITGLTSTEHILAAIADWASPGGSVLVTPNVASAPRESGVTLENLLPKAA